MAVTRQLYMHLLAMGVTRQLYMHLLAMDVTCQLYMHRLAMAVTRQLYMHLLAMDVTRQLYAMDVTRLLDMLRDTLVLGFRTPSRYGRHGKLHGEPTCSATHLGGVTASRATLADRGEAPVDQLQGEDA